jgi:hypothetical protein
LIKTDNGNDKAGPRSREAGSEILYKEIIETQLLGKEL